jgi:hypothetical protein
MASLQVFAHFWAHPRLTMDAEDYKRSCLYYHVALNAKGIRDFRMDKVRSMDSKPETLTIVKQNLENMLPFCAPLCLDSSTSLQNRFSH